MQNIILSKELKFFLSNFFLIFGAIAFFLILEYLFNVVPCKLCLYQRWPYYLGGFILLLYPFFKKNITFFHVALVFFFVAAFGISVFHILVENGFVNYTCNIGNEPSNIQDLKAFLQLKSASDCSIPYKLFNIRLSILSMIYNLILISLNVYFMFGERKKLDK